MTTQENVLWQTDSKDAPLPPIADPREMAVPRPFVAQYRKIGPIFRMPGMPGTPSGKMLTILTGPDVNAFVARYADEFFVTRDLWNDFDSALGSQTMNQARDGEANRQRRAITSRNLSRAKMLDRIPRMIEIIHEYTQNWQADSHIELRLSMQRVVGEQLGQLLVNHGPGEYLEDFIYFLNTSINNAISAKQVDAFTSPDFLASKARAYELGRLILAEHRRIPVTDRRPDMLDEALAAQVENPELFNEESLTSLALSPLLVGLDTVANTCIYMLYGLLKTPQALERVVKEADAMFRQGPLSWEKLKTMHATHGTAMETLRLYPLAPWHRMKAIKPITFAGFRIDPEDEVLVVTSVPHFLSELYPDPDRFDIDRFDDPRYEHRQRGAYAPFGLGDHSCLGQGIAEIQLMVILATVLHTFELVLDPAEYDVERDPAPLRNKQVYVRILRRRSK